MNDSNDRKWWAWLITMLAIVLVVRLTSLWFNNSQLFFDEAQYWFWAQEPAFGYFSKPPLLAWIIALFTKACGSDSEFCVRLAAPVFHIGTAFFVYLSGRKLFDRRTGFWSAATFALLPAVSLSSTIISTDVPLLFFWSVALYAYIRLSEAFELNWALLLGLAIGLGLNAKYAMIYFVGCALIHALGSQQDLTPARKGVFWVGALIGVAMLVPNIWWNYANDFVTASHTGDNIGWSGFNPNWTGLAEFFGSQFGVFGPVLFGMFLATVYRMTSDSISPQHRLLLSFSLPVLVLIVVQALVSKAYANWAATTYVAASILVAEILVNRVSWGWMRTNLAIHCVVFAAVSLAVCFAAPGQLKFAGHEPFERTQGADLVAAEVALEADKGDYSVILTNGRKLSALMQYQLRKRSEDILAWREGEVPHDHFQMKAAFQDNPTTPVLLVTTSETAKGIAEKFTLVEPLGKRPISAGETRQVYLFRLDGYEGG